MADSNEGVLVGGVAMLPNRDIVDNAVLAPNVTTLVSLVQLAGLVDTLKGEGPFTVFGPTNDAFGKVDPDTVASLQEPENLELLQAVLTYHVVAGAHTAADLWKIAEEDGEVTTVQGGTLWPVIGEDDVLWLKDETGATVGIETADVISSNGVTHVISGVLMPKS
ncbi:MAG: fasciclin domain-containing protein [Candidatus Microsaccharimonas sp.]